MSVLPPKLPAFLSNEIKGETRPLAFIIAGHNGSGKSTLWYRELSSWLQSPMINADRITLSVLPPPTGRPPRIPDWAVRLRDEHVGWQRLSQQGARDMTRSALKERFSFAFETVFSHWEPLPNGRFRSKVDDIRRMQRAGFCVVLLFVGLASVSLSVARVRQRRSEGGHDVPIERLISRFARTQSAIAAAAKVADLTLLVDNSLLGRHAYRFVRAQRKQRVLYDIRDGGFDVDQEVKDLVSLWLAKVAGRAPVSAPNEPAQMVV